MSFICWAYRTAIPLLSFYLGRCKYEDVNRIFETEIRISCKNHAYFGTPESKREYIAAAPTRHGPWELYIYLGIHRGAMAARGRRIFHSGSFKRARLQWYGLSYLKVAYYKLYKLIQRNVAPCHTNITYRICASPVHNHATDARSDKYGSIQVQTVWVFSMRSVVDKWHD